MIIPTVNVCFEKTNGINSGINYGTKQALGDIIIIFHQPLEMIWTCFSPRITCPGMDIHIQMTYVLQGKKDEQQNLEGNAIMTQLMNHLLSHLDGLKCWKQLDASEIT